MPLETYQGIHTCATISFGPSPGSVSHRSLGLPLQSLVLQVLATQAFCPARLRCGNLLWWGGGVLQSIQDIVPRGCCASISCTELRPKVSLVGLNAFILDSALDSTDREVRFVGGVTSGSLAVAGFPFSFLLFTSFFKVLGSGLRPLGADLDLWRYRGAWLAIALTHFTS